MVPRDEIEREWRERVKTICCPSCGLEFTDAAIDWELAWQEGRMDLMRELRELGFGERDGDIKLKCELCEHRSWLNPFERAARSAADETS